jgi:hypothetical protein
MWNWSSAMSLPALHKPVRLHYKAMVNLPGGARKLG